MQAIEQKIQEIAFHFGIKGRLVDFKALLNGHINTTYRLFYQEDSGQLHQYTLQAINRFVFQEPEAVMDNIVRVTAHIRKKVQQAGGDVSREVLTVVPTLDGQNFFRDSEGEYWRVYEYIDNASTFDVVNDPHQLYNAGFGFGTFQQMLCDFPMDQLHETIPDFHNTGKRFADLLEAKRQDRAGRADEVRAELEFFEGCLSDAKKLDELIASGELPMRVTHNDTKFNNILIDDLTGEALCVIDLDTVMPGLSIYDFGDAVRFAASTAAEDETDLSKVSLDLELYKSFASGFVTATSGILSDTELYYLPFGAKLITAELASRFLADHLNGDEYFRISHEGHNLERARNQIRLAQSMEEQYDEMCGLIKKYM